MLEVDCRIRPAQKKEIGAADLKVETGLNSETYVVEQDVDSALIEQQLSEIKERGIDSISIVLMHSYALPRHEEEIQAIANKL